MTDADSAALRDGLAGALRTGGQVRARPVEEAFRVVARHLFLPGTDLAEAYADEAIPVKWSGDGRPVSSSSQPAIMAIMLEQLGPIPGQRVLEIGTGTGYNAALLAHLVKDTGSVVSVEMDAGLAAAAREHLREAGCPQVSVIHGDGAGGWPEGAPYDRIILTASARDLAPAWTSQLGEGGRLVLPLALRGVQQSVAFERAGDHLASVSVVPCGFVPLRGALAGPDPVRSLGQPGLFVRAGTGRDLDLGALAAALGEPGETLPTGVTVTAPDLFGGLGLWLALHDRDAGELAALGEAADSGLIPSVITHRGMRTAQVSWGPPRWPPSSGQRADGPATSGPPCAPTVTMRNGWRHVSCRTSATGQRRAARPCRTCASAPTRPVAGKTSRRAPWSPRRTPASCSTGDGSSPPAQGG